MKIRRNNHENEKKLEIERLQVMKTFGVGCFRFRYVLKFVHQRNEIM